MADLQKRLADKQLSISLTPAARDYIIDAGYDPVYGARPLRRFLQSHVETAVGKLILREDLAPRTHLVCDYDGHDLTVKPEV